MEVSNLEVGTQSNDVIIQATAISFPRVVAIPHFLNDLFRISKDDDLIDVFLFDKVDSKEESNPFNFVIGFSTDLPRE